jgi:hypothetical protein
MSTTWQRLKIFIQTLHPLHSSRMARLDLVKSIKLPICPPDTHRKVAKFYLNLHPTLDDYLTFNERLRLLCESGWVIPLSADYYHIADIKLRHKLVSEYAASMSLDEDLKVYRCGISYLD